MTTPSLDEDPYVAFDRVLSDPQQGYALTKGAALTMHAEGGAKPVHPALVPSLFNALDSKRWPEPRSRTANNWRWRVDADLDRDSRDGELTAGQRGEVRLERDLVRAAGLGRWTFQMSTMSGIVRSHGHARRAIDLVHRVAPGHFEFIELKTVSNSPLYAAFEILRYGLTWCHARRTLAQKSGSSREHDRLAGLPSESDQVLDAHRINLIVLAPCAFYNLPLNGVSRPFDLARFANSLNRGLTKVAASVPSLDSMILSFRSFENQEALLEHAKRGSAGRPVDRVDCHD